MAKGAKLNNSYFRPDVRLISSRDEMQIGLQRELQVIWFPPAIGHFIWENGPCSLGKDIEDLLAVNGLLTHERNSSLNTLNRNTIFNQAISSINICGNEDNLLLNETFIILGCGGLGSQIALQLASLGVQKLILVDGDIIEESNLNRLFWARKEDIGVYKTERLAIFLQERYETEVQSFQKFAGKDFFIQDIPYKESIFLILAGDSTKDLRVFMKGLYQQFTGGNNLPRYIHAGYIGRYCITGPIVSEQLEPCIFCNSAASIVDDKNFIAPSAAPNNAIIAGIVCSQILLELMNKRSILHSQRMFFDLSSCKSKLYRLQKDINCDVCKKII